mmetsp:Transcript_8205/g.9699  ORF Transcript_8205/g.9699 Transcript_8205/m.9699 type:complete len:327 (-) Transcript_8205:44-1024(-)|eukprot:CAMPEP_0204825754 /NCGR_PEP_ID=MMETSP1346-20131115/3568_1 /ASSEMBLY_ACC=CAM_ASM_000771 /TAXON_ID=215587 /ORGANISM="Aplanochytrium stocchinoi, Strain GSBS06" /LENGTH=326 /DNA_ID=CAMNT_0051953483 /DNA_START=85 /DNA_END=1065 /DNA_ORIENTATION=+
MAAFVAESGEGTTDFGDFSGPIWQDLSPIPVPESDTSAVHIYLSKEFEEIMGYFRAILVKDEKSPRALALTKIVIENNAANYTAWFFRRECLKALGSDLKPELDYVSEAARDSPKNYQIWYHRRAVVDLMNDGSKEKDFTAEIIEDDSKNYHAWAHRQWSLLRFNLWNGELDYTDELIQEDLRNNSAWNQRWYVVQNTEQNSDGSLPNEVRKREIRYAQTFLNIAPHNESPYNYIIGLMRNQKYADLPFIREHAEGLYNQKNDDGVESYKSCPPLLGLLVIIYEQEDELKDKAIQLCNDLAEKHDRIRSKYWKYKKRQILTSDSNT